MPQPDLHGLLSALAAGENSAFAELYAVLGVRLYRTAWRITGSGTDAEEAVQEVFLSLVKSRQRLQDVEDLAAYVFMALRRAAMQIVVRRSQRQTSLEQWVQRQPTTPSGRQHAMSDDLEVALRQLPWEQREVISLKIDGELTFAEIGRVLNLSPNTASSRYRYALEKLRALLNKQEEVPHRAEEQRK
jgi:RNA polymerase sigma-70 factor, ECF subfamily